MNYYSNTVCLYVRKWINVYFISYLFFFSFIFYVTVLSVLQPEFAEPIPNVTIPVGRDVSLPCVVSNLGSYKVGIWILFKKFDFHPLCSFCFVSAFHLTRYIIVCNTGGGFNCRWFLVQFLTSKRNYGFFFFYIYVLLLAQVSRNSPT